MANKNVINRYKYMYQQTHTITPAVYASLAMALHRMCGYGFEELTEIFAESQVIWEEHSGNLTEMLEKCYEETGIELRNK